MVNSWWWEKELTTKGTREPSGVMETFCVLIMVVVMQLCESVKIHRTVCTPNRVNCAVRKVDFQKGDFKKEKLGRQSQ